MLAVGGYKEVLLIDAQGAEVVARLSGQIGKVTALAFSPDGQHLAAASGAPGTNGEIRRYDVPSTGLPDQKPKQVLAAHADLIYDVTFSPDSKLLATTGYDRLIKLWDVATGKEIRVLKDHSDTVYSLSFSPDGNCWPPSGRPGVKVWEVATGKRLYSLANRRLGLRGRLEPDGRIWRPQVWTRAFASGRRRQAVGGWSSPCSLTKSR